MSSARSVRSDPVRRLRCQARILRPTAFFALPLMAGVNPTKLPRGPRTRRPRKVQPRKSKLVCCACPGRFASLQNTTFVFSGCSSRPSAPSRAAMAARSWCACSSVSQWATTSSAYRSNGHPGYSRAIHMSVAVGTALGGGPPHRSQRAGLPHWAPASGGGVEAHLGVGVQDAGRWEPSLSEAVRALPGQVVALAATPKRLAPVPGHLVPEGLDRPGVARHGVVGEVSSHHTGQPGALLRDGPMPACLELVFDLLELGPHPLGDRDAPEPEPPAPGLPADVREAQEVERLRLSEPVRLAVRGGEPPELDQASLVGMQLQGELREPLAKVVEELLGVTSMLEPNHEVVRPAHDDHVTACVASPPLPSPLVQHIVEVHVGEQRRGHAPNAMDNWGYGPRPRRARRWSRGGRRGRCRGRGCGAGW